MQGQFERGVEWPKPWLSLNSNFESGGSVTALVEAGTLHPENDRIFRFMADPESLVGNGMVLHRHDESIRPEWIPRVE